MRIYLLWGHGSLNFKNMCPVQVVKWVAKIVNQDFYTSETKYSWKIHHKTIIPNGRLQNRQVHY